MLLLVFWHFQFVTNLYRCKNTKQLNSTTTPDVFQTQFFFRNSLLREAQFSPSPWTGLPSLSIHPSDVLSKPNTRAFSSLNPLHAFFQSCYNAKDPAKPEWFVSQIWHGPWPLFSGVALEIQQDDSSAAGRRKSIVIPFVPHSI